MKHRWLRIQRNYFRRMYRSSDFFYLNLKANFIVYMTSVQKENVDFKLRTCEIFFFLNRLYINFCSFKNYFYLIVKNAERSMKIYILKKR